MYERFFQLRERPFALSPDPDYLYPSTVHREALGYLRYGIEGHAGFVVITGEIGSGKTTLLQSVMAGLDRHTNVARITNTMLDPRELLEAIVLDFGIDPTGMSKPVLLRRLADFLVQQRQAGRLTLLVVDEAQNLTLPALEEIRMLSNLETEKSKLIQIILVGQPELRDTLAMPQLEQLRQRITVSYHLQPLDVEETARYINHRLKRAALGAPPEFPRDVTQLIHQRSRGVPRLVNVIADATLLFAYGVDRRAIDMAIVNEALGELDATGVLASGGAPIPTAAPARVVGNSVGPAGPTFEIAQVAEDVKRREELVAARERQMAQREQQLAAQQRVLEEEARLLANARGRETAGATASASMPPRAASPGEAFSAAMASAPPVRQSAPSMPPPARPVVSAGMPATHPPSIPTLAAPARIKVQPYSTPVSAASQGGFLDRLRRILFGPAAETGA